MTFHPFEVSIPHVAYAVLGGFVVFFGMFSLFIREKLYIGEACWAFLFGVIIGPYGAGIFDPRGWGNGNEQVTNTITLEFTRVVLAIGVFAIGVELPKAYMARHWKSLFFLLVPVMTWGWFVSAGLIYALIPKLNFLSSLAVAACLTPTDPILAAAVVGGKYADKHVPAHLRHLLAAESGCNDGAAFPFLYISLYLIMDKTTARAVEDWFLTLWLYQIVLGTVWGAMLGFGFRHLMKFCERKDLIDRQSYVAQYVSLALLTIGTTTMLGSDDLLAAFSCGTAFAWDGFFNKQTEQAVFSSVIDLLFNVAAFVFVGAWTPFKQFDNPELSLSVWRLVVIAILVLVLRRLPAMIALYKWIPDVKSLREAVFSGHFGPMGIGAVFISTLAAETLASTGAAPDSQTGILTESIQPIVAFMVVTSIIIHGLSIPFFSLGRRVHSVSRTWSRHVNDADAPEWTTHTRAVMRGEDIVINRDAADHHHAPVDAMERGELGSGSGSGSDEKSATAGEATPPRRDEESDETKEGSPVEERYKAENAPDGDDILQEWKEGPHRVIERRAGPGEEVEVEVQRNVYGPSDVERITRAFHGKDAHHAAHVFLGGLERAGSKIEETAAHAAHEMEGAAARAADVVVPGHEPERHDAHEHEHEHERYDAHDAHARDEEEGWASDRSAAEAPGPRRRAKGKKKPTARKKGRAFFGARAQPQAGPGDSAQGDDDNARDDHDNDNDERGGVRGNGGAGAAHAPQPGSSPEDEPRGRRPPISPVVGVGSGSDPYTRRRASHLRIESLRGLGSGGGGGGGRAVREASPARSVRFADERTGSGSGAGSTGALTPRGRGSFSVPGSQVPSDDEDAGYGTGGGGGGGGGEAAESPRNRVTFELPDRD